MCTHSRVRAKHKSRVHGSRSSQSEFVLQPQRESSVTHLPSLHRALTQSAVFGPRQSASAWHAGPAFGVSSTSPVMRFSRRLEVSVLGARWIAFSNGLAAVSRIELRGFMGAFFCVVSFRCSKEGSTCKLLRYIASPRERIRLPPTARARTFELSCGLVMGTGELDPPCVNESVGC